MKAMDVVKNDNHDLSNRVINKARARIDPNLREAVTQLLNEKEGEISLAMLNAILYVLYRESGGQQNEAKRIGEREKVLVRKLNLLIALRG